MAVSTTHQLLCDDFNQEECRNAQDDKAVDVHISWIMVVTSMLTVMMMIVAVVVSRSQVRQCVEEDISKETAHGKCNE